MLSPIKTCDKMKANYSIQIYGLKFQPNNITPKKVKLYEVYDENPTNTTLHGILVKHRENKKISNGDKSSGIEVI